MTVANTLVYYDTATITVVKRFIVEASALLFTRLFLTKNIQSDKNW